MNILGIALKDALPVRIALTKFKGIGDTMSKHICRRLEFHEGLRVHQLSEAQQNKLTAFLSDPSSVPYQQTPVQPFAGLETSGPTIARQHKLDPLENLLIESDLRRAVRQNIAHHRNIGTLKGRRHAQGYPVRGQRTKTNAQTAKKLNKVERAV